MGPSAVVIKVIMGLDELRDRTEPIAGVGERGRERHDKRMKLRNFKGMADDRQLQQDLWGCLMQQQQQQLL